MVNRTNYQNIGVGLLASKFNLLCTVSKGGAHALDLVGGDYFAAAIATDNDAFGVLAGIFIGNYSLTNTCTKNRIVVSVILKIGAVPNGLVTSLGQPRLNLFTELVALVICS